MKLIAFFYKVIFQIYVYKSGYQRKDIHQLNYAPRCFLVISNTALGDTLLSTPAIKSLKKSFPDSKVLALLNNKFIPLFENYNYIDEIIPFYGRYRNFFSTLKKIKKHNPEVALIFHANAPIDIFYSIMSGCEYVLKHPTKSSYKKYLSFDFLKQQQHAIEDRLDLVRRINGKNTTNIMQLPEISNYSISRPIDKFVIGLQIGASHTFKIWPIKYFKELISLILKYHNDIVFFITGVEKEYDLAEKLVFGNSSTVFNYCGKYSIKQLPSFIKSFDMLITNDTGTLHLAIALKISTISLFSPTKANETGPYQDLNQHVSIQKDGNIYQSIPKHKRNNNAMMLIKASEVYEEFEKLYRKVK